MLVNIFITGLNQVCDKDIDKINKPRLPIAAGDLSPRAGLAICIVSLALAGLLAIPVASAPFVTVLAGSTLLGAAYSAPPFRLKRWPSLAALSILVVRGLLVNICFFLHARQRAFLPDVGRSPAEAHLTLVAAFFSVFGVAIALLKDVPDTRGDKQFDIPTLSTKLGRPRVFAFASNLVTILLSAASLTFAGACFFSGGVTVPRFIATAGFAALAVSAFKTAQNVDPDADGPVAQYYMHIWSLFYLSYILLPLVR